MEKLKSRVEDIGYEPLRGNVDEDFVYSFLETAYHVENEREETVSAPFIGEMQRKIKDRTMTHHEYSHFAAFARCYEESSNKEEMMNIFLENIPDAMWGDEWSHYDFGKATCVEAKLHPKN